MRKVILCGIAIVILALSHMEDRRLDGQESAAEASKATIVALGR